VSSNNHEDISMPVVTAEPPVNFDTIHPDTPIFGGRDLAILFGMFDATGEPDEDRVYYHLNRGNLPGFRVGKAWASTMRMRQGMADSRLGQPAITQSQTIRDSA
jgi:hypothetical protein